MSQKLQYILFAIAFVLLFVLSIWGYHVLGEKKQNMNISYNNTDSNTLENNINTSHSNKYVDFEVYDSNDNRVKLSDFIGKPIVINFWTTWCGYCKQEMPAYNKVYAEYGTDVVFMMIDVVDNLNETKENGLDYFKKNNYTMPIYFDNDYSAITAYNAYAYPTSIFIDKEGNIAYTIQGPLTEQLLTQYLDKIK